MIRRSVLYAFCCFHFVYAHTSKNVKNQARFEMVLESIQYCRNVSPPFAKKITILPRYKITVVDGKRLLSGNTTVTAPTPFLNFSARSYTVDDVGRRKIVFQITQASCRNILAKSMIKFGKADINTRTCMLNKGVYYYDNLDLNKIAHALPGWHLPGRQIHEFHLVSAGITTFCNEVTEGMLNKKL